MKILKIAVVGILGLSIIASCNKKHVSESEDASTTISEINLKTQTFLDEQRISPRFSEDREYVPTGAALHHDVAVAVDCFWSGVGWWDSIDIGSRASAKFGKDLGYDLEEAELVPFELNPFDIHGVAHVDLLHKQLTVDREETIIDNELDNEAYIPYAENFLLENYGISPEETPGFTLENLNSHLEWLDEVEDYSLVSHIELRRAESVISDDAADVLNAYFTAMEGARNYEDFRSYSEDAEATIFYARGFSETDKNLILSTMALTRHDLKYWTLNL